MSEREGWRPDLAVWFPLRFDCLTTGAGVGKFWYRFRMGKSGIIEKCKHKYA